MCICSPSRADLLRVQPTTIAELREAFDREYEFRLACAELAGAKAEEVKLEAKRVYVQSMAYLETLAGA